MSNNHNFASFLPPELASQTGYGAFEQVSSLSSMSAGAVDRSILEHENPNRCTDLAPAISLDQYRLNADKNPIVIRKKANEKVVHQQEVAVRFLKPPAGPKAGDIVIKQLAGKQVAPAPPLIVRQTGGQGKDQQPLVVREAPPQPPQPLPGKQITLPSKTVPPPARKVIIERLPPTAGKPQSVLVERWLPYGQQTQRVVFQACKANCVIPDPKNVIIQWDAAEVEIRQEFKNLGVQPADPQEYISRYGSQLVRADAMPEIAIKASQQASQQGNIKLAANSRAESNVVLEGDVQALKLIDLDANGLGHLRALLSGGGASGGSASDAIASATGGFASASYSSHSSGGGGGFSSSSFAEHGAGGGGYSSSSFAEHGAGGGGYSSSSYADHGADASYGSSFASGGASYNSHQY